MENKDGRNKITIDWDKVNSLLTARCDGTAIASMLGIHPNTLYRRVEEEYGISFSDYQTQKRAEGCSMVLAKQFQAAMAGDRSMLIWWGKQYLGQKDKLDHTSNNKDIGVATPLDNIRTKLQLDAKPDDKAD